jgi:WD40 repeat protein
LRGPENLPAPVIASGTSAAGAAERQDVHSRGWSAAQPNVRPIAIDPDGRWLVSGGSAADVLFWDLGTGKSLGSLSGHTAAIEAVVLRRDGRWLASGSDDGTAKLWRRKP